MIKDFYRLIMEWVQQHNHQQQIQKLYEPVLQLNERNPEKRRLWDCRIRLMIPDNRHPFIYQHPYLLDAAVSELSSLSQYVSQQKIFLLAERHFTNLTNHSDLQSIKKQIYDFHSQIVMWENGSWHRQIQNDRYGTVNTLSRHAGFKSEWHTATFLGKCGYFIPSSKLAFKAWQRFSGQQDSDNEWMKWGSLLGLISDDPIQVFIIDFTLDTIFGNPPLPDFPSFCLETAACFRCPLMNHCNFFTSEITENSNAFVENLIRLNDIDEIDLSQLLVYLAGNRWTRTPFQQNLLATFFETKHLSSVGFGANANDEKFLLFLKGLRTLVDKVDPIKPSSDGTVFNKSAVIYRELQSLLTDLKQEAFYTLILDNRYRKIHFKLITRGTLNRSIIHPREVFAPAIQLRAAAIILVHNHPSGDPRPSTQDIEITKRLTEVGNIVGINVIDHVIMGHETYFSFVDEDLM